MPEKNVNRDIRQSESEAGAVKIMKWTFGDVKNFAKTVSGGDDYNACDFRRGFVKSGTAFPDDWQDVFIRFATAGTEAQNEFLEKLKAGAYREKWGAGQWEQHRA